jgi:hypothetical protein
MRGVDSKHTTARQRDAAARRRLGIAAVSHTRRVEGSKSRRWSDPEIRRAVLSISGGQPISRMAYKLARRDLDPNLYPSHNTVYARCPDLFKTN